MHDTIFVRFVGSNHPPLVAAVFSPSPWLVDPFPPLLAAGARAKEDLNTGASRKWDLDDRLLQVLVTWECCLVFYKIIYFVCCYSEFQFMWYIWILPIFLSLGRTNRIFFSRDITCAARCFDIQQLKNQNNPMMMGLCKWNHIRTGLSSQWYVTSY